MVWYDMMFDGDGDGVSYAVAYGKFSVCGGKLREQFLTLNK